MTEIPKYVCPYCSAEVGTDYDDLKSHITAEHQVGEAVSPAKEPEETFIKGMGLGGHRGMARPKL